MVALAPASQSAPSAPLEHLVREPDRPTRPPERAVFLHSRGTWQTCRSSFASSPTPPRTMPVRKSIDSTLDGLREWLDALHTAFGFLWNEEHRVRLASAKGCRISGLRLQQDDRLKATLPARVLAVLSFRASGRNPRSHHLRQRLKNGISRMTNFGGVLIWSIFPVAKAKILSRNFVVKLFSSTEPEAHEVKMQERQRQGPPLVPFQSCTSAVCCGPLGRRIAIFFPQSLGSPRVR